MLIKKLTLAAALVAATALTASAQTNSSNPTQAPSTGAATNPAGTASPDNPGPAANMPGNPSRPNAANPSQNSSVPSQAPTTGQGQQHHPDARPVGTSVASTASRSMDTVPAKRQRRPAMTASAPELPPRGLAERKIPSA